MKTHKINETCVSTDFDQYVCVTMTLTVTFKLPDFLLLAVQDINKLKFTLNLLSKQSKFKHLSIF